VAADEVEFREFFASQYTRLCWLGLLLTGDRAEAEELAQEALARTWWRWAVHRPDDPAAYARKVLLNRRRSLLRRADVEARFLARPRAEPVPPPGEDATVLWQAVQGLPPRQRRRIVEAARPVTNALPGGGPPGLVDTAVTPVEGHWLLGTGGTSVTRVVALDASGRTVAESGRDGYLSSPACHVFR
jgi:Sigma-70 region 2